MHHCLRTTEILLRIFSEFDPRQTALDAVELQRPRRTLTALARTCQAFKDPALDVIWARLNSIDPLIRCLPSDAWSAYVVLLRRNPDGSIEATSYLEGSFRLTRPLTTKDWSIIMPYAQRVRELAIYSSADAGHSSAVLLHMLDSPSAPLLIFPSLRALYWSNDHKEALPCIERCLSPTLSHLYITSYSGSTANWTWDWVKPCILDALEKKKAYLFEFECSELPVEAIDPLSDLICGWKQLRSVRTIILNARASIHLASLSSLRELHISTPLGWGSVGYRFTLPSTGAGCLEFPETLEKLTVSGHGFSFWARYLAMLRAAPLSLSITSSTTNTAVEIQDLLNVLVDHISPHRLRSLRIAMAEPAPADTSHVLSLTSVAPLTEFTQLEDLDLAALCPGSIQDGGIHRLVSAWPKLKRFLFGTEWDWSIEPSLTFQGLQFVLENCGKLEEVGLFMDFAVPPELVVSEVQPYTGIVHPNVKRLNVGCAECVDLTAIRGLLLAMLPNVDRGVGFCRPYQQRMRYPEPDADWYRRKDRWTRALRYEVAIKGARIW